MNLLRQNKTNKVFAVSGKKGIAQIIKISHRHRHGFGSADINGLPLFQFPQLDYPSIQENKGIGKNIVRIIYNFTGQLSRKITNFPFDLSDIVRYLFVQKEIVRAECASFMNDNSGLVSLL